MTLLSIKEITSNGDPAQDISFNFSYLNQSDIKVFVGGVEKTRPADWDFTDANTIDFVSHPPNGTAIRIERQTPNASRVVDFQDGSVLSESDLDNSADQIFFIAQEAVDKANSSIIKNSTLPGILTELQITNEESNKYLVSLKYIHQIQVAILELFLRGQLDLLNANLIYLNDLGLVLEKDDLNKITNIALNDLKKLIENLGIIYGHKIEPEVKYILLSTLSEEVIDDNPIITFNDDINTSSPVIYIQDITFHHQVAYEEQPIDPMWAKDTDADLLEYFLVELRFIVVLLHH